VRPIKIISIKQPWASLIAHGLKDVENRTWPTHYRGLVFIHASQRGDPISRDDIEARFGVRPPVDLPEGGIVGITEIVDCVSSSKSRWHAPNHFAFVLENSKPLPFLKWKGGLSLRDAPPDLVASLIF
jgi:hypothetical protein